MRWQTDYVGPFYPGRGSHSSWEWTHPVYESGFSRETEPIGYVYLQKEFYYKELAHVHICIFSVDRQARDLGHPMGQFQSHGWQPGDPDNLVERESLKAVCWEFPLAPGTHLFLQFKPSTD